MLSGEVGKILLENKEPYPNYFSKDPSLFWIFLFSDDIQYFSKGVHQTKLTLFVFTFPFNIPSNGGWGMIVRVCGGYSGRKKNLYTSKVA